MVTVFKMPQFLSGRSRRSGQAMVEFALVLPVLILVLVLAIDLGRAFYAWVTIHNAARAAATYAATHPHGWNAIGDPDVQSEYVDLIIRETAGMNCDLDVPLSARPKPLDLGADGLAVGSRLKSDISCDFHPITPLVTSILGSAVRVSATAIFPIRVGIPGVNPPLPPCFGQAQVPLVLGDPPATAATKIGLAGLVPVPDTIFYTTGTPGIVRKVDPGELSCQTFGAVVTYFYRP